MKGRLMEEYNLESKEYNFFGYEITLLESIKILKYLRNKLVGYNYTSLEQFSYLDDNNCFFRLEDCIDNNIIQIEEIDFTNDYENVKNIILAISTYTDYKLEDIKKDFKAVLKTVKQNTAQYNYDETLEDYRGVKALLEEQGAREIQFVYGYECDCMMVRYENPKSEKVKDKYKKNGYEIVEIEYSELKEQLIADKMKEIENDINRELDNLTKDYKTYGTDEALTEEEKYKALHNTYKNIKKSFIKVMLNNREEKLYSDSIIKSINDNIEELENKILGGDTPRYKTELLKLMKNERLNQISKNDKGEYYYTNLFKILVNYYNLLGEYQTKIEELKWIDDGISAKYENEEILLQNRNKKRWYEFYKIVKDKYKRNNFYSVYFSFLYNTEKISFKILKKIFRVTKLTQNPIKIYSIPTL